MLHIALHNKVSYTLIIPKQKEGISMAIPKDPVMLLSYINTQLRDFYPNLDELCSSLMISKEEVMNTLESIDYTYNPETNRFE